MNDTLSKAALLAFHRGPVQVRRFIVCRVVRHSDVLARTIIPVAIRDRHPSVRLAALECIAARPKPHHVPLLSTALGDPYPHVRAAAVHCLAQHRSVRVGQYLQSALGDSHPDVRVAAARGLGEIPVLDFSAALERALKDRDDQVRLWAARSLARVGRIEALAPLHAMAAQDSSSWNRRVARRAIEGIERRIASREQKRHRARMALINVLLDDGHPRQERERAKLCLICIGDQALIPLLEKGMLDTDDTMVHLWLVEIMASLPASKCLQNALIAYLHHVSPPVRRLAIRALGDKSDQGAIFYLSQVAREAEQATELLTWVDERLAREAIARIERRARGSP